MLRLPVNRLKLTGRSYQITKVNGTWKNWLIRLEWAIKRVFTVNIDWGDRDLVFREGLNKQLLLLDQYQLMSLFLLEWIGQPKEKQMIILNDYKILCGERGTLITKKHFFTKIQENIDGHTLKKLKFYKGLRSCALTCHKYR